MSNPENGSFYMSEIDTFLPAAAAAAAAALRAENRPCLVKALEDKLRNLAVKHAEAMERKRMETFKESLRAYVKLEAKFVEERAALEAKYQKLYEPLYSKRFEIVNGVVEVEGLTESLTDQGDAEADVVKGIPDFWLNAFKNNVILAEEITERDDEALKYLKNIEWSRIDDPEAFKLEFFFDTNPFFKNSLLTKTYHMIDEDEPRVEKAIGTQIEWIKGKCLTQKVTKKKPRKGAKNAKPITKTEDCESFFHFFSPPEVPEYGDDIDENEAEDLQNLLDQDYDIGSTIRDEIIPHAVSWFTGEAVEEIDLTDDDDDEDIIEEDDEDEDEEEYEDEESK